jgi:prepilin-type N-terminal cleavage/methylation domain-containing protein
VRGAYSVSDKVNGRRTPSTLPATPSTLPDAEYAIRNTQYAIRPAFTLIELIVVLMALVIVAAAVVPALRGAGHQADLTEVAARVAASARFARDEAVARQVPIVLTVGAGSVPAGGTAVRLAVDTQALAGTRGAMGPGGIGMGTTTAAPASIAALPAAFARVPLPPRCQARLEALPATLNGSPTLTPASGSAVDTLRFPPDGRTMGGLVVLTDNRGRTIRVVITPDTGVVEEQSGNE